MNFKNIPLSSVMAMLAFSIPGANAQSHDDIVATARNAGQFSTLLAALDAAGLTGTLDGDGPFTVLAPTDDAFARLPDGTVERLLMPENKERLRAVLTYHVISGRVSASQVKNVRSAETLQGQRVTVSHDGGAIKIDEATVTAADIRARNGIIHIIDRVLIPEAQVIPEVAAASGTFSTLLAAVGAAGLGEALSGDGPFTVFAPTDEAFEVLPAGTLETLLEEENLPRLSEILKYHVVPGRVYADDALRARQARTLSGDPLRIRVAGGGIQVNDSRVTTTDIQASNGVIHVIDAVLLPPERPEGQREAEALLALAIERGVPLFNQGQAEACAAIYEVAATAVLQMGGVIPEGARRELRRSLMESQRTHDMRDRAWTLRYALDETMRQIGWGTDR